VARFAHFYVSWKLRHFTRICRCETTQKVPVIEAISVLRRIGLIARD